MSVDHRRGIRTVCVCVYEAALPEGTDHLWEATGRLRASTNHHALHLHRLSTNTCTPARQNVRNWGRSAGDAHWLSRNIRSYAHSHHSKELARLLIPHFKERGIGQPAIRCYLVTGSQLCLVLSSGCCLSLRLPS